MNDFSENNRDFKSTIEKSFFLPSHTCESVLFLTYQEMDSIDSCVFAMLCNLSAIKHAFTNSYKGARAHTVNYVDL